MNTAAQRTQRLAELLAKCVPVPESWAAAVKEKSNSQKKLLPLPCKSWGALQSAWRKALKWTDGLDRALSVMLASALSTDARGDQLWVMFMSPPSTGKTSLAEGLGVAGEDYVIVESNFTNLYSGYKEDKEGKKDFGLIARIKGKTLVIKEADTILRLPNREQLMSQLRDLFDTNTTRSYGHGVNRKYENHRCTVQFYGTGSLKDVDANDLGARFLTCSIMDRIDDDFEDEVCMRVVNRAAANLAFISNGRADDRLSPEMTRARQLTGGYVQYLRRNTELLLSRVEMPDWARIECAQYAKFVSHMRARPSTKQGEVMERELSARLSEQMTRLMGCLAAVLGRFDVDREVMNRVRAVAVDTSKGRTLTLARHLYEAGAEGISRDSLSWVSRDEAKDFRDYLSFLRHPNVGVVEQFSLPSDAGTRYRLTAKVYRLYQQVMQPKKRES